MRRLRDRCRCRCRPAQQARGDRHAGAEPGEQHEVALAQQAGPVRLVEGDGDGGAAGVAGVVEREVGGGGGETAGVDEFGDHHAVGLVGHEVVDVGGLAVAALQQVGDDAGHVVEDVVADLAALHVQQVRAVGDGLGGGGATASAAGQPDQLVGIATADHVEVEESGFLVDGRDHGGSGAVAEQDAGGPVLEVHEPRVHVGADDQGLRGGAQGDQRPGQGERGDEAGAGDVDVEAAGPAGAEGVLHQGGGGRDGGVACGGGDDEVVDFVGVQACRVECGAGGVDGEVGGGLVRCDEATGDDLRLAGDPLRVGAGDDPGDLLVGHHAFGQIGAGREDAYATGLGARPGRVRIHVRFPSDVAPLAALCVIGQRPG